jgi:RNA polymerase sigma-70 factor (ECF subfamily)
VARAVERLCPSWLSADRDDIIQITLLRLHQSAPRREGNSPLAASYLWKTAYTVMIDEIRRRGRRPEVSLDDTDSALTLVRNDPSPEEVAEARQLGDSIRGCLRELVTDRRAAVVLHLQGHTLREIATLLGWNEKKAENLVYRALADLRACLRMKGKQP